MKETNFSWQDLSLPKKKKEMLGRIAGQKRILVNLQKQAFSQMTQTWALLG